MADVLVTGGTGGLGRRVVDRLQARGDQVRITSRRADARAPDGVAVHAADLRSGRGLAEAVAGVDVVVHCASSPIRSQRVEVDGARHLLDAIGAARPHLLYISIVGVDRHPFSYYRAKHGAEQVFEAGPVPLTIQRATQFHDLLDRVLSAPFFVLPRGAPFQVIDVSEVADRLVELAAGPAAGRVDDIGGPELLTVEELKAQHREVLGRRPRVATVRPVGKAMTAFRDGLHTTPDHRFGTLTWRDFLVWKKATSTQ